MHLHSAEELDLWNRSAARYQQDYHLTKLNDLVLMGAILTQQIVMFRAQQQVNGLTAEFDASGVPTGRYIRTGEDDAAKAHKTLILASGEIQKIEAALGIDKVTREKGGQHTVAHYVETLKKAAHIRGLHISKRTLKYEEFVNDLRWQLRLLRNGDAEDRGAHNLTDKTVLEFCHERLTELEEVDKTFARERGKLFIGQL